MLCHVFAVQIAGRKDLGNTGCNARHDPDLQELRHFQYSEYDRAARAILQMATEDGRYRWDLDMGDLAVGLIAVIDGVTLRYCVDPETKGLEATLREFGEYLLSHLIPVGEPTQTA